MQFSSISMLILFIISLSGCMVSPPPVYVPPPKAVVVAEPVLVAQPVVIARPIRRVVIY